jgi:sugar phosphate isomerase/epimerase
VKDRKAMPEAEQRAPSRLLDGDVDWKEVMRALSAVGYRGPLSPEIAYDPNDATQLLSVSKALDKILSMA